MDSNKSNVWKAGIWVAVFLSAFLFLLSISEIKSIFNIDSNKPANNTIAVSGKGEAVVIPDIATFSFGVTETAKTVADAQNQATTRLSAALKALHDNGVADKDIQTESYTINPHYEYMNGVCTAGGMCPPSKSVLTGYDVSQTLQIKVRDLSKAGQLFGIIGGLNVQNVNGLSFSVDNIDAIQSKAQAAAIADARQKADTLARELGVHIARIVSFSDANEVPPVYPMAMSMASKGAAADRPVPEIPQGEQKITSQVSITYEIR